jgi:hypothetical protein
MSNINKSLFSLMATNNGFFKSEKQSAFLLKFADNYDNEYMFTIVPELKGCKFVYFVYADNQGITKAIKSYNSNAKSVKNKEQVTFERLNDAEFVVKLQNDLDAKNAKKQAYIEHLNQYMNELNAYHLPILNEKLNNALEAKKTIVSIADKIDANIYPDIVMSINENIEKAEFELLEHQNLIASIQAQIDAV